MIFSNFFKPKKTMEYGKRVHIKSKIDLRLLPNQVIYVEGAYKKTTNKVISNTYGTISSKLKQSDLSADFLYLPIIVKHIQKQKTSLDEVLSYYFPNIRKGENYAPLLSIPQTDSISRLLFSFLSYNEEIVPGFFRYMGQDSNNLFVYEYFLFTSNRASEITNQINNYINTISSTLYYTHQTSVKKEEVFESNEFQLKESPKDTSDDTERPFPRGFFDKQIKKKEKENIDFLFEEDRLEEEWLASSFDESEKIAKSVHAESESLKKVKSVCSRENCLYDLFDKPLFDDSEDVCEKKQSSKEYELISQIKSDIQNLKELGFYEILLKEIGSVLFEHEKDKMFQPSQLVIDDDFRIFLSDFDGMEIEMTPLPKSLFVLFLRHPEGIHLKSLIEYKIELLEIYKLLSYRETYFDMVESINRICNPLEGSINEKLSRIKEAFLKKISIDTAKYYIVKGERGMKKKIEIDSSLIVFPNALMEIGLTKTSE